MVKISSSILSVRDKLESITNELNKLDIDYMHIDVMDGLFVPNTAVTIEEAKLIKENTDKPFDIHVMAYDIDTYVDKFMELSPKYITIHYEVLKDLSIIDKIHNCGIGCGISIKPNTKVEDIYPLLDKIDLVLVMSVEPGFGGQKFIPNSLHKIKKLRNEIDKRKLDVLISVDGGINNNSAIECMNNGVDILVIGSALTNVDSNDRRLLINKIKCK